MEQRFFWSKAMLFRERSNALLPEKRCSAETLTKSGGLRKVF